MKDIETQSLLSYLYATSWTEIASTEFGKIFQKGDATLYAPLIEDLIDTQKRIDEAVKLISEVEEQPLSVVIEKVRNSRSDIIFVKLEGDEISEGEMPFDNYASVVDLTRRTLMASSMQALGPKRRFQRLFSQKASDFVHGCRVGLTQPGSYIIPIICPLDSESQKVLDGEDEVYLGRESTRTLMLGFHELKSALQSDMSPSQIAAASENYNANFCAALSDMFHENSLSAVSVSASWASGVPEDSAPVAVELREDDAQRLTHVVEYYERRSFPEQGEFVGTVDGLLGDPDGFGGRQGYVQLNVELASGETVRAKVELNRELHEVAIEAYRHNKPIFVSGKLDHHPRVSTFRYIFQFRIVSEDFVATHQEEMKRRSDEGQSLLGDWG